jgi:hypothetical protein
VTRNKPSWEEANMTTFTQDILELKSWHDRRRPADRKRLVVDEMLPAPTNRRAQPEYLPTPAEIRAACLEIQSEWSATERERRAGRVFGTRPTHVVRLVQSGN